MVSERLWNYQEDAFGSKIALIWISRNSRVLSDYRCSVTFAAAISIKLAVCRKLRMKCHTQQASLVTRDNRDNAFRAEIQEIGWSVRSGLEDLYNTGLLDDKNAM